MTVIPPEKWDSIPGFGSYEASTLGEVRSVDRTLADGRRVRGRKLATRVSNKGYVLVNMTDDHGAKQTRTLHTVILTTFDGECPPDQTARHLDDDPLHNTWAPGATAEERIAAGGNLMWGTWPEQIADQYRNGGRVPAAPKPERHCIRCGQVIHKGGRRCHDCVVDIGVRAASLLSHGTSLAGACEALEYPSAEGLHTLAVKYGGYAAPPAPSTSALRRVTARVFATLRDRFRRGSR
jgi:NUMOD4 motif